MNEVKRPKKPLIFYYTLVMVALALFNFLLVPWIAEQQIIEVDYGTFITMTENKEIDQVKVEDNQILFEGKDGKIYKTGLMNDPDLVNRLHDSGAKFGGEIVEETSPLLNILLTWVLPVVLFIALGQFMSKKLMDRAGGPNSLMFNGGNSNARVYVQSSDGIKFDDVEGVDEAEESLQEIVDYLHNPVRRTSRSSPSAAPNLWRCSWAWARARCATCSSRRRKKPPASCLLTRLTPSVRSGTRASWAATTSGSRR